MRKHHIIGTIAIIFVIAVMAHSWSQAMGGASQVSADWNATQGPASILNKPSFSPVAISGNYSDLLGAPVLAPVAISDAYSDLSGKPTIVTYCYDVTTKRTNCFPYFSSASVSSGTAVFNLTVDGTAGGASIFPNGIIAGSVNVFCNDAAVPYSTGIVLSNANKTVTATVNKAGSSFLSLLGVNVLTAPIAGNGTSCNIQAMGY